MASDPYRQQQSQYPPRYAAPQQQPRPPSRRRRALIIAGIVCLSAVAVVIDFAARHGTAPAGGTVTFTVTGSSANVTYGPSGSSLRGSVPMDETMTIPASPPSFYAVDAQLNGSGSVTCQIEVGGSVISQATATASYGIASCEIVQDPATGAWQDANAG